MKFALYQPWIYLHGGLEKSVLELVTRSRHQWVVYTGHYEPENTFSEFATVDVRELLPTTVSRDMLSVMKSSFQVFRQKLPTSADTDGVVVWCDGVGDLLTFRNHDLPLFNICSTPLRAAFDPVYESLALKNKGKTYQLAYKAFKSAFRYIDRHAWRHYDGVVATSTEVKNRIIDGGLYQESPRMVMAYPGVDWSEDKSSIEYRPFILLAGRIMWTKNIQQGIQAFLKADLPAPWRLVIAGFVDQKSASYLESLREIAQYDPRVEFVCSPDDSALSELYRTASFSLFTPLNEDWGIAPLESMTNAKAVIANASGGPTESICHNKTGILLDSDDELGWAEAIRDLALNPDKAKLMGEQAHKDVKRFTWDTFVSRIDDNLEKWVKESEKSTNLSNSTYNRVFIGIKTRINKLSILREKV